MHEDDFLEEYFQICKRVYEQMERDGTWPWLQSGQDDSTLGEDMVDSEDNPKNL